MPTEPVERANRELWFDAPRRVTVREGARPVAGPGQVLVRALASGVSQGTERLLYRGEGPTPFDPSLDPPSAPTYPRRYGYAWVGEVVERGPGVNEPPLGTHVFALLPHGDLHAIEASRARALASTVPASRAVLAASLETSLTCVWDTGASLGDRVVVLGGGVIGLLIAVLAAKAGAEVRVVERSVRRRDVARTFGLRADAPRDDERPADADVVVEATGDPAALDAAVAHAGFEATVVVASFYGARVAPVSLGSAFHRRRLTLRASQVSSLPPSRAPRWTFARRFEVVQSLLADSALDALLDAPVAFDRAAELYDRLDRAPGDSMQSVFKY